MTETSCQTFSVYSANTVLGGGHCTATRGHPGDLASSPRSFDFIVNVAGAVTPWYFTFLTNKYQVFLSIKRRVAVSFCLFSSLPITESPVQRLLSTVPSGGSAARCRWVPLNTWATWHTRHVRYLTTSVLQDTRRKVKLHEDTAVSHHLLLLLKSNTDLEEQVHLILSFMGCEDLPVARLTITVQVLRLKPAIEKRLNFSWCSVFGHILFMNSKIEIN